MWVARKAVKISYYLTDDSEDCDGEPSLVRPIRRRRWLLPRLRPCRRLFFDVRGDDDKSPAALCCLLVIMRLGPLLCGC